MEAQRWKDIGRSALILVVIAVYVELRLMPWQEVWQAIFIAASILFYGIVAAVAYKGFGDVAKMIRNMVAGRGASEAATDSEGA